jgi:hypothetical protein
MRALKNSWELSKTLNAGHVNGVKKNTEHIPCTPS